MRGRGDSEERIVPEDILPSPQRTGFHAMRIAFRRGQENVPFVKVHLFPGSAEQLILASADIVVDNKKTAERCMEGSAKNGSVAKFIFAAFLGGYLLAKAR